MSEAPHIRDAAQVHAAITRRAEAHRADMPESSDMGRFASSAVALAALAVIELARERGVSVERVLDDFHDHY